MNKMAIIAMTALMIMTGCASGTYDYTPPSNLAKIETSKTLRISKDEIWNHVVSNLSKSLFVVNSIGKDSGFINVSYSGDPEEYVDCGIVHASVRGGNFEASNTFRASSIYEEFSIATGGIVEDFKRKMHLNGEINISILNTGDNQSEIVVTTRYNLKKQISKAPRGYLVFITDTETISFSTNQQGFFGDGTRCKPTHDLESELFVIMDIDKYYAD